MSDERWIRWHWEILFSKYFGFALSISLHLCSILIFIYMTLVPEGQTGEEAWKASKKQSSFENWGALDIRVLSRCYTLSQQHSQSK
jgi:hypothetical protein